MPSFVFPPQRLVPFIGLILLARIAFAFWLPITGDESYFVLWGHFPDFGFYDHPPMVGWWLSLLLIFSDSPLWLRLPSILLPTILATATYLTIFRNWGKDRAFLAATVIILAPANVWNVLITTDTPLILFGALSALVFMRAFTTQKLSCFCICGILFAAAVLSKYFAALLGLTFAVATLLAPSRKRVAGLLIIGLFMLPALALMAWWNAENCWPNILFNLVSRNARAGFHWQQPASYALMMFYMLGFTPLWFGLRQHEWLKPWYGSDEDRLYWALAWVPLILFGALSLSKPVGLHWVLTFVPLTLLGLLRHLTTEQIHKTIRWLLAFGAAHFLVIGVLAVIPLTFWEKSPRYPEVVWTFKTQELVQAAGMQEPDRRWFTDGYTYAAELSYARDRALGRTSTYGGAHVGVFGPGSHYARQDDHLTDFSQMDGQNFAILLRSAPVSEDYRPYFRHFSVEPLEFYGAIYFVVRGDHFNFAAYRDRVLKPIQDRFYRLPPWLPDCGCFFNQRYFPQ